MTSTAPPLPSDNPFATSAVALALTGAAAALLAPWLIDVLVGPTPIPRPLLIGGLGLVANATVLAVAHRACAIHGTGRLRDDLRLRFAPSDIVLGLLTALLAIQFAGVVQQLAVHWLDPVHVASRLESVPRQDRLPFALSAILFAPFAEEVLFRGLLQRSLAARFGRAPRIVLQALVFAACHASLTPWDDAVYLSGIFAIGVAFGVAVERTERLGTTIVAHAIVNVLAFGQLMVR